MTRYSSMVLAFLVIIVEVSTIWPTRRRQNNRANGNSDKENIEDISGQLICCFKKNNTVVVVDKFYGIMNAERYVNESERDKLQSNVSSMIGAWSSGSTSANRESQCSNVQNDENKYNKGPCIIFLQKNSSMDSNFDSDNKPFKDWAEVTPADSSVMLKVLKKNADKEVYIHAISGNCTTGNAFCKYYNVSMGDSCKSSTFDEENCLHASSNDRYTINMTSKVCINCDNPVKKIEEALPVNMTIPEGGQFSPSAAAELMSQMSDLVTKMNGTAAALSLGESVKGVIVKQKDPTEMNEISLAYDSPIRNFDLIEDRGKLVGYSRFVTVSKEAFDKAKGPNMTSPFAAVLKFTNMSQENITILGDEVLAVEMGASIQNLTDTVNISVNKIKFQGIPVCNSWDGKGDVNWTTDGCETLVSGDNIICQCTHLTFFAILLTPLNGTNSISTYDLNTLTTLTRVGCGLSMFFLCIVLFMHFLIRKTKPNISTVLFIHLVTALLLLNFTFLINDLVANLNNPTGCEAIAFLMHYFMLVTFTWFAVHAFHLCLQMYMGSNVTIKRYVLKVSVTSWTLPSIFGIVFLITKKYGELRIYTSDSEKITKMCWITDNSAHMIVNVGYYVLVFLLTFSTVITSMYWLCRFKQSKTDNADKDETSKRILFTLGLCSQLGVTWGFAFFAYGEFRIPAYYIFTVLNSLQGFFLFIYYYNSGHVGNEKLQKKNQNTKSNSTNVSTLKSGCEPHDNPYST